MFLYALFKKYVSPIAPIPLIIEKRLILIFKNRLDNLKNIIKKNNFVPIFITQIKFDGLSEKKLFLVNQEIKKFCKLNSFHLIPLDELMQNMEVNDFYDEIHPSVQGSLKIANIIYPSLEKIFNE